MRIGNRVSPIGSFTDPEYAQVGLTEARARETHDVVTTIVCFDSTTRTIIDGHKLGFCKLITDRKTCKILGCHVVGERAVEITQVAAIAIAAGMRVDDLAHIPLSFPTYAGILARVAASAARELNLKVTWQRTSGRKQWRSILRERKKSRKKVMDTQTPARTYNQNHIPRKYAPGKRRLSIYWTWSYPWESQRDPQRWKTVSPR